MKKVMICLSGGFLFALTALRPQDPALSHPVRSAMDTTSQTPGGGSIISRDTAASPAKDTTLQSMDSVISLADDPAAKLDTVMYASSKQEEKTPASAKRVKKSRKDKKKKQDPTEVSSKDTTATPPVGTMAQSTGIPAAGGTVGTPATGTTPAGSSVTTTTATSDSANQTLNPEKGIAVKSNEPTTVTVQTKVGGSKDSANQANVATGQAPASTESKDAAVDAKKNAPAEPAAAAEKDTATKEDKTEETKRELDTRWFISPLLKVQFQDFAMLEKNRKGYLSDANTLPFFKRGNASFAASAYKNLTQRLSVSADIGLSFGHVTNNDVLISQTQSKTYNLLNAALYYHLLAPSYRLQPYVTVGINDVINDASYASVPMGIGAKFNSRKIMVMGQVTYGAAVSKSISNTTMYSLGIYLPIKNKKQKQLDQDDKSAYNRKKKDDEKKDSANKGGVVNNIYITINMDSILKAKGLLDANGNPIGGRRGNGGDDGDDDGVNGSGGSGGSNGGRGGRGKRSKAFRNIGLDDFDESDYRLDSLDGKPVIRFVVYFEFNEYGLTTKAFGSIDKVISHLKRGSNEFDVEIKGYTDSIGTNSYNNLLSRRRAKMVLDYMNSRGVPTELMKARAYGSDDPVGDNSDPNQAWLNRRAEIIVHQKETTSASK